MEASGWVIAYGSAESSGRRLFEKMTDAGPAPGSAIQRQVKVKRITGIISLHLLPYYR